MSEAQGQEKKDEKSEAQNQEKGVVGYSKAFTESKEFDILIEYLIKHYGSVFQAFAGLPTELYRITKEIYDSERTYDWRDLLIEVSRVQALNDLIVDMVKTDMDYTYFTWWHHTEDYLKILAKLASIWKVLDKARYPENKVKPEELQEQLKAVEEELKKTVFDVIRHAYNCNEPEDEEGCCDDEPEESDDDTDYYEEEPEEESDEA